MKPTRYPAYVILALAASLLASCSNTYGIFSSIQEENKTTTTSTFYRTTVKDLVPYNGNYYARLVALYSRPAGSAAGTGWTYLENSAFGADYVCTGLAATSAGLYAAISDGRGSTTTPKGIYLLSGSTWTQAYAGTETIQALYAVNDNLFVVTRDSISDSGSTYSLRHWNGSALEATGISSVSAMPVNGAYFNGAYWFAAGSALYSNASATSLALVSDPTTDKITALATDEIGGTGATALFLGSSTGHVYRSADGTTWSAGKPATYSEDYGVAAMTAVPTGTAGVGRVLLVGSAYDGYYEADVSSSLGDFTAGDGNKTYSVAATSNYDSSLDTMPVFRFVYTGNATSGSLFACASSVATDYTGLWSDKWTTAWAGWASE